MLDRVYNFTNFFDKDEREFAKTNFKNHGHWELEGASNKYIDSYHYFWFKDLIDHKGLTYLFKDKVEKFLNTKIEVNRFYGNGQAHGQCGLFHTDVEPTDVGVFGSLVYYIHEDWIPEYGGHLLIKGNDEIVSVLPETNSAVLFNSKIEHCPLEPTVYCRTQRVSLAFKFKIL